MQGYQFCPVCLDDVPVSLVERHEIFRIWRCQECELEFADPMEYSTTAYSAGYVDSESELAQLAGYAGHIQYAESLAALEDVTPFLIPLEKEALLWISRHFQKGSPILDLGCGIGRFMMALSQQGFLPYGLDVAQAPIEMLTRHGFSVRQGSLESYSSSWPSPQAVTCFEVLEHVASPVDFLNAIHEAFPKAVLVLGVPFSSSRRRFDAKFRQADYPPNHLTRWTRKSLSKAFEMSGYEKIDIRVVHVTGDELKHPVPLVFDIGQRVLFKLYKRFATSLGKQQSSAVQQRRFKRYILLPHILWLRIRGGTGYWFLATANSKSA